VGLLIRLYIRGRNVDSFLPLNLFLTDNKMSSTNSSTKWDSMESIIAYAGSNPTIAVTYPEDKKYGLISDPIVIIQEVRDDRNPFAE
jgi:hypothetical protein